MDAVSYLESIIGEAREALAHRAAGGTRAAAFDKHVSINALHSAFNKLFELNAEIRCDDYDG